mmetsp:Transcript_79340/g.184123  ORF Transcript_79340/g.184123 Transcript_79340/m.184123 type:complete len:232 (-) Transcript_79340:438-1133(-)
MRSKAFLIAPRRCTLGPTSNTLGVVNVTLATVVPHPLRATIASLTAPRGVPAGRLPRRQRVVRRTPRLVASRAPLTRCRLATPIAATKQRLRSGLPRRGNGVANVGALTWAATRSHTTALLDSPHGVSVGLTPRSATAVSTITRPSRPTACKNRAHQSNRPRRRLRCRRHCRPRSRLQPCWPQRTNRLMHRSAKRTMSSASTGAKRKSASVVSCLASVAHLCSTPRRLLRT